MPNVHNPLKLTLYVNFSDEKRINKNISQRFTLDNVYMKEGTSILQPIFTFHKFKKGNEQTWKDFNYLKVSWGGDHKVMMDRFYFVRDLILMPGGIVEIHCEEDVRYTWRSYIKNQEYIISRQEYINNRAFPDGRVVLPLTRAVSKKTIGDVGMATTDQLKCPIALTVAGFGEN